MDSPLRRQLISSYEVLRNYPCFLQKQVRWVVERLTSVPVIIQFHNEMTEEKIAELKAMTGKSSFADARMLPLINGMATKISLRDLQNVCDCGVVSRVTLDREVKALLDNATSSVGSRAAQARGITGRGVGVAVIDTGIHPHPDVYNQIIAFKDFINNRRLAYDDNGHGTHCAGDVAGNGTQSAGRYVGTAPEARLIGVKVLNSIGSGSLSTVIQGIEWCVDNRVRYGIRVISMSLGSTATTSAAQDPVVQAVERAWNAGIVVCVAAGNDGPDAGTIASPGISRRVITVGAADDQGTLAQTDDEVADFSSRGPTIDGFTKPDVVAPGVNITSLRAPNSFLDKFQSGSRVGEWYFTLSGTSMATPIVAGYCAQLLQVNPSLTPDQVKAMVRNNAVSLGDIPNNQGRGEIRFPADL